MFWRRGRCRWWLGPTSRTGFALGVCARRRKVFSMKPPPGRVGRPLDGEQPTGGVFKQDFEVLWGVWFDQGGRFQTRVWPKVTDSLPVEALTPFKVTSPLLGTFTEASSRVRVGVRLASGRAGFVHRIYC